MAGKQTNIVALTWVGHDFLLAVHTASFTAGKHIQHIVARLSRNQCIRSVAYLAYRHPRASWARKWLTPVLYTDHCGKSATCAHKGTLTCWTRRSGRKQNDKNVQKLALGQGASQQTRRNTCLCLSRCLVVRSNVCATPCVCERVCERVCVYQRACVCVCFFFGGGVRMRECTHDALEEKTMFRTGRGCVGWIHFTRKGTCKGKVTWADPLYALAMLCSLVGCGVWGWQGQFYHTSVSS